MVIKPIIYLLYNSLMNHCNDYSTPHPFLFTTFPLYPIPSHPTLPFNIPLTHFLVLPIPSQEMQVPSQKLLTNCVVEEVDQNIKQGKKISESTVSINMSTDISQISGSEGKKSKRSVKIMGKKGEVGRLWLEKKMDEFVGCQQLLNKNKVRLSLSAREIRQELARMNEMISRKEKKRNL